MTFNKSNVIVSGSRSSLSEYANYTTVYPKPAMVGGKIVLTQDMINKQNVKYIIKWNFDLDDETITVPEGCLIEFDGGSFSNGTLVGNKTILVYNQEEEDVFKNVSLEGSFERSTSAIADKMDNINGMAKIYLKKNKPLATQLTQPNTIYVIQYDFTLGEDITVPANCVLEFEGGSINGAYTLTGNNTVIEASLYKIFNDNVLFDGSYNVKTLYAAWFGLIPNNNQIEFGSKIQRIFNVISSIYPKTHWSTGHYFGGILLKITAGKYWATQEITIPDNLSGVTISGDTQGSVIVYNNVSEGNTLFKHTTLEGLWEWKISNITFISNNNRVFYLNCYYNSVIEDCSFYAGNNTIKLGLTCGTRIKKCSFVTGIDTCILIDGSDYVGPDTTFCIEDCWAQHIGTFIKLGNVKGSEVHILNTTVEYSNKAFDFNYVFNATFTNCYFEVNTEDSTIYSSNVRMTGCHFASSKKVTIRSDNGTSTFVCELPIKTDCLAVENFTDVSDKAMKLYFGNDAFIDYNAKEALYKRRRITGTYVVGYGYLYEVEYIDSTNGKYFKGLIKRSGSQWSMQEKYSGNVQPSTANNAIYFGESDDYDENVSLHVKMIPDYLSES